MNFGLPHALWLLPVVAALALLDGLRQGAVAGRWPGITRLWAGRDHVDLNVFIKPPRVRWRFWSGLALMIVALASPRWGPVDVPLEDQPKEVLIALDLSRSMAARDVRPSRLDHAKLLVQGLLDKLAGERAGLVLFAGTAYLQLPLSVDYDILAGLLPNLSPDYFPQGGTNYDAMLRTSLAAFSQAEGVERILVVLSDGEAFDDQWKCALAQLQKRGVHIIALGVGTSAGGVIPLGAGSVVKDVSGSEVVTKLKPATLEEMAKVTGGVYMAAPSWVSAADLLKRVVSTAKKTTAFKKDETRRVERYQWALVPALVFLALSFWRELPVQPRARGLRLPAAKATVRGRSTPGAGATVAGLMLLLTVGLAQDLAEMEDTNGPASRTPMATLGAMVGKRIEQILAKPKPESFDWVSLTIDMIAYMENTLKARQRFPLSVADDARRAIDLGESIEKAGGDWDKLRADVAVLVRADKEPWKTARPDAAGKSELPPGFDPDHDMKESNGRGGPGVASDPNATAGVDDTKEKFSASSAFGEMETGKRNLTPPPPLPSDMQLVGNEKTAADIEREEHPELILPLQKLDHVRSQDAPAKLFQMLEGTRRDLVPQGPDW
ncbi:MAG: VWA domain-containing protein [Undibacterium sp.]|nr:VWA domain-containing protein [Opitutaceae bacterium]